MSRTRHTDRPYVRSRRARGGAPERGPARLAALAGSAARASVERLEPRQMLFSLTITADSVDPNTGLGTAAATFGFHIPVLENTAEIEDDVDPETVTEQFDDLGNNQVPPTNIGTGFRFPDSGMRVRHTVLPPSDIQVDAQFDQDGDVVDGTERLEVRLDNLPQGSDEQFTLDFDVDDDPLNAFQNRAIDRLTFDAGDANGGLGLPFNNVNIVVTLADPNQTEVVIPAGDAVRDLNQFPFPNGGLQTGRGTFVIDPDETPGVDSPFLSVRFEAATPASTQVFAIDNVAATVEPSQFSELVEGRIFGAELRFRGPVGASVEVRDLLGRDMRLTTALETPDGGSTPLSDLDKNGIPDFNDGIGEIILRNTDARSSVALWGGTLEDFTFDRADSFEGLFDAFEGAGFGLVRTLEVDDMGMEEVTAFGLPPTQGSVIIGAPFERPLTNYNVGGLPPGLAGGAAAAVTDQEAFNNPDQGIRVADGSAMGRVTVHGVVFGSSQFTGTLEDFNVGVMLGSLSVAGDLGSLTVAVDAGVWTPDPDADNDIPLPGILDLSKTGSELVVGRTVREILVGGRSLMDVTVQGDLDNPQTKPPRDVLRFEENEHVNPVPEDVDFTIEAFIQEFLVSSRLDMSPGVLPEIDNQARLFGTDVQRNDTIMSAEWIGSAGSSMIVTGQIGMGDPAVNTAEDAADVFAFATDGTRPVEILSSAGADLRVVDQAGRTLGAVEQFSNAEDSQRLVFNPPSAGVFYMVVSDPGQTVDGDFDGSSIDYTISVSGLAPTTLGSYRTGASTGNAIGNIPGVANTVNVLSGSIGAVRVGTAFVNGAGQETEPFNDLLNTSAASADEVMEFGSSTFTTPGDLFAIIAGSDIEPNSVEGPVSFNIGGDLGALFTGQSPVLGTDFTQGDVSVLSLSVGGNVGTINVNGAIGIDQDTDDDGRFGTGNFQILTGMDGTSAGDIGLIRVGSTSAGDALRVDTPDNAVIGALLFNQDIGDQPDASGEAGIRGPASDGMITTGIGADVRFVDLPEIDLIGDNSTFQLLVGQPIEVTDDAGASVRITINGVGQGTGAGLLRLLPIDGSEGVAIAQLEANLSGNRSLDIRSIGADGESDPISIGRIEITDSTPLSDIDITGPVPIDVWRIEDVGGMGLNDITNDTPGGDIVAADVSSLNNLTISDGHLGRTELPGFGPRRLGPDLTIGAGLNGQVGGPIGVDPGAIDPVWSGAIFRPTNNAAVTAFLDDIGGPVDPFLDGLIVRTGSVQSVEVAGAIGDLILQDPAGRIVNAEANTDGATALGGFDGIVGNIYAAFIDRIEVGDGLRAPEQGPIANTGIFAVDEIVNVDAGAIENAGLSGLIIAANLNPQPLEFGGIDNITVEGGGSITDSQISVAFHDVFWTATVPVGEVNPRLGDIDDISVTDGDITRSIIEGIDINTIEIQNGFFDANDLTALSNVGTISATGFRNSTIGGTDREFRPNRISVGENLDTLTTETMAGDVLDLLIDVKGDVTTSIDANNFTRVDIQVDNEAAQLIAAGGIRGSNIVAGDLPIIQAGTGIVSSRFRISGALESFTAGTRILNADVAVTGPNGRIDLIRAPSVDGIVAASGPIDTIESTAGDVVLELTTTGDRGVVHTLAAARDLVLDTDVSAGINTLLAGRHIGDPDDPTVILVEGNVTRVSAPNGQLYSDVRAGGTIGIDTVSLPGGSGGGSGGGGGGGAMPGVTIGRATNLTGESNLGSGSIVAFDRIGPVVVNGDFDGSIVSYSGGLAGVAINNGSLLPGNRIAAFDGDIESLVITNGHLLGDVHADFNIVALQVLGGTGGVFGDVGINPALSATTQADGFRNELPLGVIDTTGVDGPSVRAGRSIVDFTVANGSIFEASVHAGRRIVNLSVAGDAASDALSAGTLATTFTAGDELETISIGGDARDALFAAGLFDLGGDDATGGVGFDADTVKSGRIDSVSIGGDATRVDFASGVNAGPDGRYATDDDTVVIGRSVIRSVTVGGQNEQVTFSADSVRPPVRQLDNVSISAASLPFANPALLKNVPDGAAPISAGGSTFTHNGVEVTLSFTGPGNAFFDAPGGRVVLDDSSGGSTLVVNADGALSDFDIVSGDDDSLGLLDVNVALTNGSAIVIDRGVAQLDLINLRGGSSATVGETVGAANVNALTNGFLEARAFNTISIAGNFGNSNSDVTGEAGIDAVRAGSVSIGGGTRARINVFRNLDSFISAGPVERALLRVGDSLGAADGSGGGGQQAVFSAPSVSETRISVANQLGPVAVAGDVFDSALMIGGDLGADADFGGVGINADRVSTGVASTLTIGGDFAESDLVAGYLRGPDGFFGTPDDAVASGRSTVGLVTIDGTQVGSTRNTESFLIASTGTLEGVTIGGEEGRSQGNFEIREADTLPTPIRVTDLDVIQNSGVFTARLFFNQDIDASTLSSALSIREVRGGLGGTEIFLIEGRDFTLEYDAEQQAALVRFDRDITERDLPQLPGLPGPGVFRFVLDSDILAGQVVGARLDGDGDGFAESDDPFSADTFVGDVGDRLVNNTAVRFDDDGQAVFEADFRAPGSLDLVLDDNFSPDGIADPNTVFTINGTIGDHPDHDNDFFGFASDVDVFTITLQAGQILRLGAPTGAALLAPIAVFGPSGAGSFDAISSPDLLSLPVNPASDVELTTERALLARETGLFTIAVGAAVGDADFGAFNLGNSVVGQPDTIPNLVAEPNTVGSYSFTVEIFDDGNSGFNEPVDSGSAQRLVDAPEPERFTGPDGEFGTADDPAEVTVGASVFTLDPGPDGQLGTSDDVVSGGNGDDTTSVRSGGVVTTTVTTSLGTERVAGIPGTVFSDLDVFELNNGREIDPGTVMRLTVKLAEFGGDLGSRVGDLGGGNQALAFQDFTGQVQFGLFDTTDAEGLGDADLVFSPTDFSANGGAPGVIASNANNQFGFDDNGDFFIQFVAPGRIGSDGTLPASYAVLVQGAFNSDFALEVVTLDGPVQFQQRTQNVFIETQGGSIDWLEVAGQLSELEGFDPSVLGLVGSAENGQPIGEFILDGVIENLERIYDNAGIDVNFSTNPADFEFEDFSTVFLSSSVDPVSDIFEQVGFGLFGFGDTAGAVSQPFGFAERSDPLNTDSTDEAVVFVPTFSNLGRTPAPSDVDALIESISAAVGRHVGELLGLRLTGDLGFNTPFFDTLAADSVVNVPDEGQQLIIPTLDRSLSDPFDSVDSTDFWLGEQDSGSLLERILSPA